VNLNRLGICCAQFLWVATVTWVSAATTHTVSGASINRKLELLGPGDTVVMAETVVNRGSFQKRTIYSRLGLVQVITAADIKAMPVRTLNEVLQYAAGIDLRQRGPNGVQADLQMQGSTFDQVLLLVNGVKMSDPQTGHHQLNLSISPEVIERIEIVKGAAAHMYGVNAMAGVVNIITKTGTHRKKTMPFVEGVGRSSKSPEPSTFFSTQQGIGSKVNPSGGARSRLLPEDNYYRAQSYRFLQQFESEQLTAWYGAEVDYGNGYRPNTAFQQIRANAGIHGQKELKPGIRLDQQLTAGMIKNQFGANGFYAAPRDSSSYEFVNTLWAGWSANISGSPLGDILFSFGGRSNQDRYIFNQFNPSFYQNFHTTSVVNPMIEYSYRFRMALMIKAAVEYRKEMISSTNLGDRYREFWGKRLELVWYPLKPETLNSVADDPKQDLQIAAGLYQMNNSVLGTVLYPGGSLLYRYKKHFFTSRWGTGQRLPTFTDLYYRDPVNLSNPNLKTESSMYYDAGYRWNRGKWNVQTNAFRRDNSQLIDRVKDSLSAPWIPINAVGLRVQGWDIGFQYQTDYRFLNNNMYLRVGSSYSRLEALRDEPVGNQISQYAVSFLPQQWINSVVVGLANCQLSVYHRMVERAGSITVQLPSGTNTTYHLWDAKFSANGKIGLSKNTSSRYGISSQVQLPFTVWVQIQNISNTLYRDFASIPLLPRWVTVGLQVAL
jgi:vitamin B12 transporter